MKKTNVKSIARFVMGLACVLAFTTTNLGCACTGKRCSNKPCCKKVAAGCKEGCKKGCNKPGCTKTASKCKPGCQKPCCKKG